MCECIGRRQKGNIVSNGSCLRPVEISSKLLVPDDVQYMKYCGSSLKLPKINYEIQNKVQSLRSPNAKLKSWTNEWMVRWMQDQETAVAIRDLKTYIRRDREIEIEEQTIKDINSLSEQDALWYIQNLRNKPQQVRVTGKNQMDVSGVIITMDMLSHHPIKALIDSGCTGSCINKNFVKEHDLNMIKLLKSIPVFGSSNIAGKLTHTVQLQVIIRDHKEIMEFGVSNLGTSNIFLGHDWLKHHNLEIDWKGKTIQFNHCPGSCYKEEIGTDPEDDISPLLGEGEQLLAVP